MNDEFYIGWEENAPTELRRRLCRIALLFVGFALATAVSLAAAQRLIGPGAFEWGRIRTFTGEFHATPVPHLRVARPGRTAGAPAWSTYYLVKRFKFGLDAITTQTFDGIGVRVRGTLIHRGNQTMIEVADDGIERLPDPTGTNVLTEARAPVSLGRQTLEGEIVDSKCFLGVMNPGNLIPHRACAIRCLSGGIPPLLLVHGPHGPPRHVLLVGGDGRPLNRDILKFVAEPVRITGELMRQGDLLWLRAEPSAIRRVRR